MAKRNRRMIQSKSSQGSVQGPGVEQGGKVKSGIEELAYKKILEKEGISVAGLVSDLTGETGYKKDRIISKLIELKLESKLKVVEKDAKMSLTSYSVSPNSFWFLASLIATVLSLVSISITSGDAIYLRYLFGGLLILFLPGYSLVQFLFPRSQEMQDVVTRIALSIGMSLALIPLIALGLNYTPFGIRILPVAISLFIFTVLFLFLALVRKHSYYKILHEA